MRRLALPVSLVLFYASWGWMGLFFGVAVFFVSLLCFLFWELSKWIAADKNVQIEAMVAPMVTLPHPLLSEEGQRIAVVGSGISGLATAWILSRRHYVVLYEAGEYLGGHTNTVDVKHFPSENSEPIPVDTGFIVYNARNYPNLVNLFQYAGVVTEDSDMSFAVSVDGQSFEYSSDVPLGLLNGGRNLLKLRFWKMFVGLVRFYLNAHTYLEESERDHLTLAELLTRAQVSQEFIDDHILPTCAALWSAPVDSIMDFPASTFIRFFINHGLFRLIARPQWKTVSGGARKYVKRLSDEVSECHVNSPVEKIERFPDHVVLTVKGKRQPFDQVVVATHADQALEIISDPTESEAKLLGAIKYQRNTGCLHSDPNLMPNSQYSWGSWNYVTHKKTEPTKSLTLTYWMNRLQNISNETPLFMSLNCEDNPPREDLVHYRVVYHHPIYNFDAFDVRKRFGNELNQGEKRTWFCGAYFGSGFHEDGLLSGINVAKVLGCAPPWEKRVRQKANGKI